MAPYDFLVLMFRRRGVIAAPVYRVANLLHSAKPRSSGGAGFNLHSQKYM